MINGKHVVVWTPYGREETVSILAKYLERDYNRGLVDEWWLCLNTDPGKQERDLEYAAELAAAHPWIRLKERPAGCPQITPKQRNTGYFYRYMTDPGSVYVRCDDDIVYVHEDAIDRLVTASLENGALANFPVMWNNAIVSWYAQQCGVIPTSYGVVGSPFCMDAMGWANGEFAVKIHRLLLDHIEAGTPESVFLYQDFAIQPGTQYSVSFFASRGDYYANLATPGVLVPDEEESWHTVHETNRTGRPNMLIGNALVAHYSFFPQRSALAHTDVLARYRALADRLEIPQPRRPLSAA